MSYYRRVKLASYLPYKAIRWMSKRSDSDVLCGPPGSFWFDADYERYCRRDDNSNG